jgi:phytoene dehydrogenase-like protein
MLVLFRQRALQQVFTNASNGKVLVSCTQVMKEKVLLSHNASHYYSTATVENGGHETKFSSRERTYDAVIVGSGHNGLVAACYLAKAGKKVIVLERNDTIGGATCSVKAFDGVEAYLSRYSYLIALFPDQIIHDLSLQNFSTISRSVSSYTPYLGLNGGHQQHKGLLINRTFDQETRESLRALTGSDQEAAAWHNFYSSILQLATVVAPTMLQPLPTISEIRHKVDPPTWDNIINQPIGQTILDTFVNDIVRGLVLTDGLIGTFTSSKDHAANICFIYHLIGNGVGEWKVPKGGMGNLVAELQRRCIELGVEIRTGIAVETVLEEKDTIGTTARCTASEEILSFRSQVVLANCSPKILEKIAGIVAPPLRDGSQMKVNMVLQDLPRLKSGIDPKIAFSGTFHVDESFSQLERAYEDALAGKIPNDIPFEMYCHSLTDPSILSPELISKGYHSLTIFALHVPASLFDKDHDAVKAEVTKRILKGLNKYLVNPIENYLALDSHGSPCIEVKTPQELEATLGLPRGNIFHGDLQYPWKNDDDPRIWGVETSSPRIFFAGSGAVRGGGVSGIAGHNAAMAALSAMESFQ